MDAHLTKYTFDVTLEIKKGVERTGILGNKNDKS